MDSSCPSSFRCHGCGSVACGGAAYPAGPLERRMRGGDDAVRSEAELVEQDAALGACAEVVDRHDLAALADEVAPPHRHGRLDAHPGLDVRRQDALLVRVVLRAEPLD